MRAKIDNQREVISAHFLAGHKPAQVVTLLQRAYGAHAASLPTVCRWFQRFRSGENAVRDRTHPGAPRRVRTTPLPREGGDGHSPGPPLHPKGTSWHPPRQQRDDNKNCARPGVPEDLLPLGTAYPKRVTEKAARGSGDQDHRHLYGESGHPATGASILLSGSGPSRILPVPKAEEDAPWAPVPVGGRDAVGRAPCARAGVRAGPDGGVHAVDAEAPAVCGCGRRLCRNSSLTAPRCDEPLWRNTPTFINCGSHLVCIIRPM